MDTESEWEPRHLGYPTDETWERERAAYAEAKSKGLV